MCLENRKEHSLRLSALLELADESFDSLKEEQDDLRRDASRRLETSAAESPDLDSISYPLYAQSSNVLEELMQIALGCGFHKSDDVEDPNSSNDIQSDLIAHARAQGIRTVRELDTVLRTETKDAKAYLKTLMEKAESGWHVTPSFVALLCIIRRDSTVTSADLVNTYGWHDKIAERVVAAAATDRARK